MHRTLARYALPRPEDGSLRRPTPAEAQEEVAPGEAVLGEAQAIHASRTSATTIPAPTQGTHAPGTRRKGRPATAAQAREEVLRFVVVLLELKPW
jgi:hypothetical protein